MSAEQQVEAWIETIQGLSKELCEDAAPEVAEAVRSEIEKTIAAGTTADGQAWQPTQKGKTPLRNASKALRVAAVGSSIVVKISGPEARHHLGRAKGGIQRPIIPNEGIPAPVSSAIKRVLSERFSDALGAR